MTLAWERLHPQATTAMLGYIPEFLNDRDPRPAREQFNTGYAFAGGWTPFHGHTILLNGALKYPGDPPMRALFQTKLHDETVRVYEHAWVVIIQKDGSFEVCRMD
jgi:hypothetical protein